MTAPRLQTRSIRCLIKQEIIQIVGKTQSLRPLHHAALAPAVAAAEHQRAAPTLVLERTADSSEVPFQPRFQLRMISLKIAPAHLLERPSFSGFQRKNAMHLHQLQQREYLAAHPTETNRTPFLGQQLLGMKQRSKARTV